MDLGLAASAVVVSPQLDSAIATANDGSLHLFRVSGQSATEVWWNGLPSAPARAVYSPSGKAAAVYASGRVQVFTGLPNAPLLVFAAEIGLSQTEPGRKPTGAAPEAMAVSDDAAWLLVASEGRLRLLGASGSSRGLLDGAREVSVAFASGGHAAAVLNGAGPWLDVYPDVSADPTQRIAALGLAEPAGLAYTPDGKFVVAAARADKSVTVFDLAAGAAATLDCNCAPTGVTRMGKLFRLTDAGSGPVWMVDTTASPARIVFVPARAQP
jgi:DNA-binding beta-propeller fold protein YncE